MNESQKTTPPIRSRGRRERPTIGLLIRGTLGPVEQSRWTGVLDVAQEQDANLICFVGGIPRSPYRFEAQENVLFELVNAGHVDGLVIWSGTLDWFIGDKIEAFCRRYSPLPVVSLDRAFKGVSAVFKDDSQGVRESVAHLIEVHGYRRIACIRAIEGQLEAEARYRGYTETLAEHGLPFDPDLVSPPCKDWGVADGVAMANLLLDERGLRPQVDFEAVVAANDEIAFGVMDVLQARGVRIPDDVAVIGFDDSPEAMGAMPPLTTVKTSFYKQGRQATELLLAHLRGEQAPERVSVPTELVVRESCGCLQSVLVQTAKSHAGHAETTETLDAALAARRPDILSAMAKAVEASSARIVPGWEAQLLDAFVDELGGDSSDAFLSALDGILHRVMKAEGEVGAWQGAVSVLRRGMLPYLSEGKASSLAEDLWHQARVLIGERAAQSRARQARQASQQALTLSMVSQTLITTFDVERVMDVLTETLPTLHIPSFYFALYERPEPYEYPQPAPEWSRLILAYRDGERIDLAPDKQRFLSRHLIPEGLLPRDRRYGMVVEPLYFREHQLGFALLEVGPRDGFVYEAIRAQLSSALQGAQLVRQVENRALQLQTAAEVSRAASSILDPEELIQRVVDLVCERFKLYFTGLFLVDQSGEWSGEPARWVVLRAGTGEAGRKMLEAGHKLEVDGTSMIGWCIMHGEARIALDVGDEAVRFNNPLLPLTRSEIALPLISRGRVIGAMAVQSTQEAAFSAEDLSTLQTMADQVANAVENARLFAERKQAQEVLVRERKLAEEGFHTFRYIVENSIDAMLMTDSELQVVYANQACNQLIARNAMGQSLRSLWCEEDLPLLETILEWARFGSIFSTARLNGFRRVIEQYPGIESVGTLAADWNRDKAYQAAEELLRAHPPGTLDVIWAASSEMAFGAMLAVEVVGRQEEVKIFSNDVTPESADRMREGRLVAETHHGFAEWGWYGTKFAVMLALGLPVPPTFDIRPRTMYTANADQFYPTPALDPIDWNEIPAGRPVPQTIVIGWIQMAAVGVYQTATEYFEKASADARAHGINVDVVTRIPATPEDFVGQAAIIEDYIQRQVDVIILSTVEMEAVRQALTHANAAGIPVIIVNQLEPLVGLEVACYIGFDNTVAGMISAYAVVDYLGGPGILGTGEHVTVEPGTCLDLMWWQALYHDVAPGTIDVSGRVAIIEGFPDSWRGENRLKRSDGGAVYVDSITFPAHNKAGQFIGLVASFRNATERKQAEAEREKLIAELEAQNAELERFTYTVSHDLKSPLVTVTGFLGFLEQDAIKGDMERLRGDIQHIREATDTMQHLLNDLLELSRIGRVLNLPEDVPFGELVQEAIKRVAGHIAEHKVHVTLAPNLPTVHVDRPRLVEVVQNLLENTIKFMGEQPGPRIEIGVKHVEGDVVFYVADNGIGIAPQYQEKIFGLFERLDQRIEGTGVGLAIVKRIIEVHDGRIWIESEEGRGTTFYFTLPFSR